MAILQARSDLSRPSLGGVFPIAVTLCAVILSLGAYIPVTVKAVNQPNIVLIMTDDLDVESLNTLLAAGLMPNLQRYITDPGVTFSQSFVSNSHGCPDRQTVFTGLYYHNIGGATDNCSVARFNDQSTLATWLHNAGYTTTLIGRYMDGYGYMDINHDGVIDKQDTLYIPPGWDNWQAFDFASLPPAQAPWWYENANMYNYTINDNGHLVYYGSAPADYQVDVIAQRAKGFITSTAGNAAPFFLTVASTAPHVEVFPYTSTVDNYPDAWKWDIRPPLRYIGTVSLPLPQPPSFNEADVSDKPQWMQQVPLLTSTDIKNLTHQWEDRLASMRAVDDLIGTVAQALTAAGKWQNTVLLFTSDNGWFYAQHRLSGKLAAYDEATLVPMMVSVHGPMTVPAIVGSQDLAPTITDLAHITPDGPVDGVSLVPLLSQPSQPWRNRILLENFVDTQTGPFSVPTYYAIRSGMAARNVPNEVYVRYVSSAQLPEFYDLTVDPYELSNLAQSTLPGRIQQQAILKKQLSQMYTCGGGTCQTVEFSP